MPFGFPLRPTSPLTVGRSEVSQIQARCFRTCMGSQTPGAPARLAYRRAGYCLPPAPTASAPPTDIDFEARNPSLCLPLSTLRPQPRGCQRMTQGRGGLLGLPRMALSSTTLVLAHWRFPRLHHFTFVTACRSLCLRFGVVVSFHDGRRRDAPYGTPPPRIPAYGAAIPGSCLRSERQVAVASLTERGDRFGLVVASA